MAENKGIMLAKSVQKHAGRAKEKILQNLGKVDRTADEIFDDHLNNFNRQQASAIRLQKEFNNYIRCIRAAQTASKSLMDAVCEIYEPQWTGYDALQAQSAASESLWQDFAHKLGDQVLIPLTTYSGQFPEMKKKVEKRNRKLIDYDGQRHSFQSLQANANKRKDDVKLTKGREQLEEARRTYEILNTELHDELPALYDSRILFLVTNLQTLFATEQVFHNETSKIYSELEAIVDKLATDSQRGSNTLRKQTTNVIKSSSPVQSPVKQMNNANINNSNYQNQITTNGSSNVNSPTPSSSSEQQVSRLDSVSPTPESTPESHPLTGGGGGSAATTPSSPATTAASSSPVNNEPSYQNAAEMLNTIATADTAAAATTATTTTTTSETKELNSPNANTTTTTTTTTKTNTLEQNVKAAVESAETAINDAALNNASNNATTATVTTSTTKVSKVTPQIPNGGSAENDANANIEDKKSLGKENVAIAHQNQNQTHNQTPIQAQKESYKHHNKTSNSVQNNNKNNNSSEKLVNKNPFEEDEPQIYEVLNDASTADLPPGVLYRVKATYAYVKEDVDELSFEIGDIIRVIEYDDPEDQEEGWLMGQKEGSTEKGLFPANFTRPI